MNLKQIQEQLNNLQEQIKLLINEPFNWEAAPVIGNINGVTWVLGPESNKQLSWDDAIEWCKSVGGELPPREILFLCYLNEELIKEFESSYYWSSTEGGAVYAWYQSFDGGGQGYYGKYGSNYVRAVRRFPFDAEFVK